MGTQLACITIRTVACNSASGQHSKNFATALQNMHIHLQSDDDAAEADPEVDEELVSLLDAQI